MPFLRFTRDKRGYESTFLVHTVRRRGKARQQILYWFRSPPDVKVGRGALDEDAIRSIEESNPDVVFDWARILEVQPPAAPVSAQRPLRPARRAKPDASRPDVAPPAVQQPAPAAGAPVEGRQPRRRRRGRRAEQPVGEPARAEGIERALEQADQRSAELPGLQSAEQTSEPVAESAQEPPELLELEPVPERLRPALETVAGREQAARLRARFAELQARITERGGDAERVEALRLQAEGLDPDSWVTADEARKGMEGFDARFQEFRRALGLGRRRRSRRGGVRRHGQRDGGSGPSREAASQAGPSSGAASEPTGSAGPAASSGESLSSNRPAPGSEGNERDEGNG